MLALYVHLSTYLSALAVLLGAAAVALLVVAWATKTNLIAKLLDAVMGAITDKVK